MVGESAFSSAYHQDVNGMIIKSLIYENYLSEVLASATRGAVPRVFVVEVDFLCMGSPHMFPGIPFNEDCCTKAVLATLELQE